MRKMTACKRPALPESNGRAHKTTRRVQSGRKIDSRDADVSARIVPESKRVRPSTHLFPSTQSFDMFISRRKLSLIPSIQLLRNITVNFSCYDYLLRNFLYSRSTSSDAIPANQPVSYTNISERMTSPDTRLITEAHLKHIPSL